MTQGRQDGWFFLPDPTRTDNAGLQPHLLIGENAHPERAFRQNLLSMNSFSPFGWLGGNVQDALWEMAQRGDKSALRTLEKHLSAYLDPVQGVVFESPMTEPRDGTFNSIEDFLPFAAIVGLYPQHPSVSSALGYLQLKANREGLMVSEQDITTEGCYTIAYPLAAIAAQRHDLVLAQTALRQLNGRTRLLTTPQTIFQRASLEGHQSYPNWGRGVAWYLLGTIKTLAVLKHFRQQEITGKKEVEEAFRRAAVQVSRWQDPAGRWGSFIDRPETGTDTSATAGIACAFVWGVQLGLLNQSYLRRARQAKASLQAYLTADGFLTGVSQINRGGEALQASDYRVISQFGMGLLAQLDCLLKS